MRFRRLLLERYGRFEDCTLDFRDGAPDLHIVYGNNEAGKSTTLAAVSDLLFGFGKRTPYNFLFDNAMLRVGAELEDDGRTLFCRRRKRDSASLVDADEQPIDEGDLLAMLRGQTRETFRLAFSLDQDGLRDGGRAMVTAKNDVGQALFAASSGLTGVAGTLATLDEEADAIWGKRAKASRTFTAAERVLTESRRAVRDLELKPKAWVDAHAALQRSEAELADLERQRDTLVAEHRAVERLRRVGPGLRRREELIAALDAHAATVSLSPQRETAALDALAAAETADRRRQAAAILVADADQRAGLLAPDAAVLALADTIDTLGERRGALAKAGLDRARLVVERHAKDVRIADLHRDLGGAVASAPSRLLVGRLREIARAHADAASRIRALDGTIADLTARERPLRDRIADATLSETLPVLVAAVDSARRLGDIDERCAAADRAADRAEENARTAIVRLAPWSGSIDALAGLPGIAEPEIAAAQAAHTAYQTQADQEAANVVRFEQERDALALDRAGLAERSGAVSADAVDDARAMRERQWHELRDHLRGLTILPDPVGSSDAYERAVIVADAVAGRRFMLAEVSGQLANLDASDAKLRLQAEQARHRGDGAARALAEARTAWHVRLADAGLPALDPIPLRTWLADRSAALDAETLAVQARDAAALERQRRSDAGAALVAAMRGEGVSTLLTPVLARAETLRQQGEARDQAFRDDRAELRQTETSLTEQRRRLAQARGDADDAVQTWQAALADTGLTLAIEASEPHLAAFEDLRGELDAAALLDTRLNGIDVDARRFADDVAALANALDIKPDAEPAATVAAALARLETARQTARARADLAVERDRRQAEVDAADAERAAALAIVAPIRAELGLGDADDLAGAIEASRTARRLREERDEVERSVTNQGDGYALLDLVAAWQAQDPDGVAGRATALATDIAELNARISAAATASGDARRSFAALEGAPGAASDALADAEQAKAEMAAQAEMFLLKRTEAVMLRWAMERHRERRQDPLLARASDLFRTLTLGRYVQLRVDVDGTTPRLGGLRDDGRTVVDVGAMSEGTTDQLFLALRLASVEQSVANGVRLPFLADDLFVNFDDARSRAGFEVLADLAKTTQVLFFTHHAHLAAVARDVVGTTLHSECALD
ncbi:AAA family ATPase [Sphingomonas sp. 4RDLI-65]|uniref:ATP-binding protein n=1 Tax=Sphingomonas sp. 4RDLI-65 TaxID=3111641 RepID=UPI003C1E3C1E